MISRAEFQSIKQSSFPVSRANTMVYFETYDSILEARAREHVLKRWRRAWKIALVEKLNPDWRDLSDQLNS
jgi:predicted GIY-YIG superfamily endonuclease